MGANLVAPQDAVDLGRRSYDELVVDKLRFAVAPTIAGVRRTLLDGLPPIRLALIRSVISPTGYLMLD